MSEDEKAVAKLALVTTLVAYLVAALTLVLAAVRIWWCR